MADGKFHRRVGGCSGIALAYLRSDGLQGVPLLTELLGGYFGGIIGGSLPDIIDPPTSPRHRSIGHGIAPIGAASKWAYDRSLQIQGSCRRLSVQLSRIAQATQDGLKKALYIAAAAFLSFLSGVTVGVLGGYLSHVALDFCTPACLPLIA